MSGPIAQSRMPRPSEIFQGIIGLLHGALDDLDLATLPRRGGRGARQREELPRRLLAKTFERAIIRAARKRKTSP